MFYTLENTGEVNDYAAAVNALNAYFAPKVNSAYVRHTFRQLQQNSSETVLQFASRLKRYAKDSMAQIRIIKFATKFFRSASPTIYAEKSWKKALVLPLPER